jgi:tripartite-type tricarboxylate transporter receptor subunit TctC
VKTPHSSLRRLAVHATVLAPSLTVGNTFGQGQASYPVKPIKVMVPFSSGGGTDVVGRTLMQNMSALLGQAIVIENKPGAGTVIGSDAVAKSAPDGYTLLMTTSALAINASLVKVLPYNTLRDFAPIGRICHGPNVIVVRADSPFKTLNDIIQTSRAKPGSLTYASSGTGSSVHLSAEMFKSMAKIHILHIPYRGAGPAYTDLIGGQVDLLVGTAGGVHKLVQGGKMRAIAVTSPERSPAYPGVPSVSETLPGYSANVWYGLFAPRGTPAAIVDLLSDALKKSVDLPAYRAALERDGLVPSVNSPVEMASFMRVEVERWQKVVADRGITSD